MKRKVANASDIVEGGLKAVDLDGNEILLCNCNGAIYAVSRRCGHMNAPCEMGTLRGTILTCPMHFAQFDVTTGAALKKAFIKSEPEGLPEKFQDFFEHKKELTEKITTCDMETFTVSEENGEIFVDI